MECGLSFTFASGVENGSRGMKIKPHEVNYLTESEARYQLVNWGRWRAREDENRLSDYGNSILHYFVLWLGVNPMQPSERVYINESEAQLTDRLLIHMRTVLTKKGPFWYRAIYQIYAAKNSYRNIAKKLDCTTNQVDYANKRVIAWFMQNGRFFYEVWDNEEPLIKPE